MGRDHQSYLLTLVDKANKMCCIRKMPNKQAKTVINTALLRKVIVSFRKVIFLC
ncbi:hypothetical protein [Piscirickettsia salmonis]|uniref:hypothetical protein n=1 Tax=Piscirickettsia salmonis TaxID=1238 RepID=UPI000AAFAA0F|nr:hypothetical protein [Piscirickettsia salmonis]